MLLLTLLPFAGWAVDVTVGDYTVTLDKQQYVALVDATAGVDAPAITKIAKGATEFTGTAIGVYDANGNTIEGKIKASGVYYSLVTITDNGAKTIKVPFCVFAEDDLTEIDWTLVSTQDEEQEVNTESYTNSVFEEQMAEGGAYYYYFQEYQWCDIWVHMSQYQDPTYGNTKGYILYPGDTYDTDLMPVTTGRYTRNTAGAFEPAKTQEELNEWAQSVLQEGIADHDWNAVRRSNPSNGVFTFDDGDKSIIVMKYGEGESALFATPWGSKPFGKDFKKYGLFPATNALASEFYSESPTAFDFNPSDLAVYVMPYPEEFEGSVLSNEPGEYVVQVTPQSGVRMPYGGAIDLSPAQAENVITLTPIEYNTIPGLRQAIMAAGVLQVNGIDGSTDPAVWKTLVPGSYTYSLGIKDADGNGEITKDETLVTLEGDARTFIIDPISDAQVVIEAGVNDFAKDEEGNFILPVLKTGLVYTGSNLGLVDASEAKTVFNSGIEYLVIPSTEDGIPSIPADAEWKTTAEGLNAGKYYVWARAAAATAGGDDEGNWEAGQPHLLSVAADPESEEAPANYAEIEKATPAIVGPIALTPAGLGDDSKYFLNKYTSENPLAITPSGAKVQFNGQDLAGAEITYVLVAYPNQNGGGAKNLPAAFTTVGDYTVQARFVATGELEKNFNSLIGYENPVEKSFIIKARPDVTITPVEPTIIGYGTNPEFKNDTIWEDGVKGDLTGTIVYGWYRNETCDWQSRFDYTTSTSTGTYWVKIRENRSNLTSTTHNVIYGDQPLQVQIVAGDIEAEIASYTGEDALIYGQPLPLKLKHTIGLPEASVEAFENQEYTNGQFTATKLLEADGTQATDAEPIPLYRYPVDLPTFGRQYLYTALPVGTYKINATIRTSSNPQNPSAGYTVTVAAGTWQVVAKDINNEDVSENALTVYGLGDEFNLTKTYIGAQIIPSADDLGPGYWGKVNYRYSKLVYGTDYEVTVAPDANIDAGTGSFTITGKGNFKGTKDMEFTIAKAPMIVKPAANQTWVLGEEENYLLDVEGIQNQLVGKDKAKDKDGKPQATALDITTAAGFKDLAVKRVSNTSVGNHTDGLKAYQKVDATTEEIVPAANYEFDFTEANEDLVIEPGTINLKVKDVTVTYAGKDAEPEIEYDFVLDEGTTLSDLMKQDGNWKRLITGLDSEDIKWSRADKVLGAPEYEYDADTYEDFIECVVPEGTLRSTNYTVNVTDLKGDLIINPAAITLKAADQGPMAFERVETDFDNVPSVGDNGTVVVVSGDYFDQIGELVQIQRPAVVKVGENEITLVPSNNSNYTITAQNGTLFVGSGDEELVLALTSQMEDYEVPVLNLLQNAANSDEHVVTAEIKTITKPGDWSKLKAYEGVPVDKITLQLKPATLTGVDAFSAWNADEWHAMVLPFEITVKELSKAFDYAYVNVVDPTATKANDVRFKLANILDVIPANTPFCIKASVPYEYETRTTEGDVTEVTPAKVLEFIPTTTGKTDETKAKFTIDLTGIATEGEGAWTVAGVDADKENLGYKFAGIYDELTIDKDTKDALRFLGTVGGVNKWYYIGDASTKTCTLPPYTGFVNLGAKTADVREVTFTFEEEDGSTTSIKAVDFFNGFNANDEVYTVDGMKVNAPTQKGVYIKNGKKVLVK